MKLEELFKFFLEEENNPVLVGAPGVGKTAIAEGLALKLLLKMFLKVLKIKELLSLIWEPL